MQSLEGGKHEKKVVKLFSKRLSVTKASGAFATAPVLKTIRFVVSTPIKPDHLAAFEQALDVNGWQTATKRALVTYRLSGE